MPASSRLRDLLGYSSPLRQSRALLPGPEGMAGWPDRLANGLWGGWLNAEVDSANARIRLDLAWPETIPATITRIHADGTTYEVRGGDPATVCGWWARWDYEAPLDQPVTYQATSAEREGAVATTAPVTLASLDRDWLKHPTKPHLNRRVSIRTYDGRNRKSRSAAIRPPLAKYPIIVHGNRQAPAGQLVIQTDGTAADLAAIDELLDDNADLMLQRPAVRGGESWYVAIDTTGMDRVDPGHPTVLIERLPLPYEVVDRPSGEAEGGPADRYSEIATQTYNQVAAGYPTYVDLSMRTA